VADYNTALRAVKFANSSDNPTAGARTIQFSVTDGTIASNALTRTLNVAAVNDAPVLATIEASAIAYTENQGEVLLSATIAASDIDDVNLEGATIVISSGYVAGQDVLSFVTAGTISGTFNAGTLTLTGSATVADYNTALRAVKFANSSDNPTAGARTIQFSVTDGTIASNALTRTLNVAAVNDIPTVTTITKTGTEDQIIAFTAIDFTSKFTDTDGTFVKAKIVSLPANGTLKVLGVSLTAGYEIDEASLTDLTFTPTADWNGSTSFDWNGSDGLAYASSNAPVNISIAGVNDAPLVSAFTATGTEDTRLYLTQADFTTHFSDVDANSLSKIKFTTLPTQGTLMLVNAAIAQDQEIAFADIVNLNFAPNANWNGSTTCQWTGWDGTAYATTAATITININSVNDVPSLSPIIKSGNEDESISFTSTNFTDAFLDVDGTLGKIKITSLPNNGKLKLSGIDITLNQEVNNANIGQITFVPTLNWSGATSFLWNGSDGAAYALADATVGITINAVNDVPTVSNFSLNGTEDTPLSFTSTNFTSSFTDVESTLVKIKLVSLPSNGQLKLNGTVLAVDAEIAVDDLASLAYHPNANWNGTETFIWNGSDGTTYATANATTSIAIAAVNDAPTFTSAANTSATQDSPYAYAITATDVENNTLTITATTKPTWLTFATTGAGTATLTGTPTQAEVGNHSVTLRVSDGTGSTDQTFTLNVANINDKPTFTSTPITSATEDVLYSYTITSTDIDGTIPNISMVEKPIWLTFTANTNGTAKLEGTPTNDNIGTFNVSIKVSDGLLDNTQSYQINVANVNDKPIINSQKTLTTAEETAITLALTDLNVTDVDNTYPTGFSMELGAGTNYTFTGLKITPSLNYNGAITVPARVNDGQSLNNLSDWFNVTISVTAVNDKPTISGLEAAPLAFTENAAAVNITQTFSTADVDDTYLSGATVSITGYVASEDQLLFTNTATISGLWNSTSGAITLTGSATLAEYIAAIRNIKYQNTSENPTTTARQLAIFVSDGTDVSATSTRTLQVTAVNDAPVPTSFNVSTKENQAKDIDMLSRVADAENNISWTTLTVSQQPTKGAVSVNTSTKTITYTPQAGASGSDTFVYSICDLSGACSTGTVTMLISDEAPDLVVDNISTPEDNAVTIDVLANDTDPQGNMSPSTLSILKAPTKGTAVVTASFKILYTPTGNANGTDLLEYQVCDDQGYCSQAAVNITINAVNDSPTIANDIASTNEDAAVLIDVLANDNDNKDPLGGIDAATLTIVAAPLNGVAVVESGKIKYTPNTNYFGTDVLTYKVNDAGNPLPALSGQATVSITVDPVNDNPVVSGQQTLSTDEDVPVTLTLAQLTVSDVDNSFPTNFTLTVLSGTNYTVSNAIVTPTANYYGVLTIPVRVSDGMPANSASNTFNLSLTVNAINDAPVAIADMVYTGENTPINFSVLGNDSDPNDAQGGINTDLLQIIKAPKSGSAVILPNKNINYTPYLGFSGKDTIEYSIGDLGYPLPAQTTNAKVFIEVFRLSPLANNDAANTNEDTPVSINLLANDTDSGNDINPNSITIVATPLHGTLSAPSSGAVTYTPSANYFGADLFTYSIKDFTNLPSNVASVAISVSAVNDAPVALSTSYNTPENVALILSMTDILSDVDDNLNYTSTVTTQQPTSGTALLDKPNKKIVYTPSVGFSGTDKFKIKAADLLGLMSNEATITVVVSNQAPKANDDLVTTAEDQLKTIDVTANDTDPQNNLDPTSVTVVTQPRNGSVTVNTTTGQLVYTPNSNFSGLDSLTYSVCDLKGYCDEAKINIIITAVNDAPVAVADAFDLFEDTQAALNLLANDTDLENNIDPETFSVQTEPAHGKLEVNLVTGTVTYKPNPNYHGSDQFTYRICDSSAACSNNATVTLTVISVNDAPDAVDDAFVCYAGTPVSLSVWMNDTDVDDNLSPSSITLGTQPKFGSVSLKPGGIVVYTANHDYTGSDSFSYSICDIDGDCDVAKVNLSVFSGNIAPATKSDKVSTAEDSQVKVLPLTNDTDPNGNLDATTLKIVTQPQNGTATLNIATGEITYLPNSNFYGNDWLVYEVCDNDVNMPLCSSDTIYVTIISANDAPVAVNDQITVFDNQQTSFNILLNDSDIDGDALTATLTAQPALSGIVYSLSPTGVFTIKPQLGQYCQTLTFEYRVCDTYNLCQTAELTVKIDALDSDHDGLSDYTEGLDANTDNDAQKNYLDTDSDNDGILDAIESGTTDICSAIAIDTDNDGKPDYLDQDSDNDGVTDKEEGADDCDKDSTPNYRDYFDDCINRQKIPETFSPNNDGVNDYLVIPVVTDYPTNELVVYNRWGNEVFRINNYNNVDRIWDGRASKSSMGSDVLPEGTYFYILTLGNGDLTLHGSIYIKR
jgi:gliding motility-associated-like protein